MRIRIERACFGSILLVLLLVVQISAQEKKDARYYRRQAAAAFQAKDYNAALENLKQADVLIPNHPTIVYNLAVAYTALGRQTDAVRMLSHLAEMGLTYPLDKAPEFAALKDMESFRAVVRKMQENRAPILRSQPAFMVDEKGLIVESVAYDSAEQAFFVSSVHKRKILRIDQNGAMTTFASEQNGLWSVLGIRVDARRRHLWAVSAALPQMTGFTKQEEGASGVFKFDLKTGRLIKKYLLPGGKPHTLGDLLITARGDVFASDSQTAAVYKIDAERDVLELFLEDERFISPQGLALSNDESQMFLADYSKGIFRIDVKTKNVLHIQPLPEATFLGIDGLYFYKGELLAIQNGVNPHRLVRIGLTKDLKQATVFEVIEANNPVFDEPTLGMVVGDMFYFVANSQWESVDEQGKLAAAEKLQNTLILKLRLK